MRILRLCCIILFCVCSVGMVAGAPRQAPQVAATCPLEGCKTFAPMAAYDFLPRLEFPINSTIINTLAPTLVWSPLSPGDYHIQVTNDETFSEFADYAVDSDRGVNASTPLPINVLVTSNLRGNTAYYWRVGLVKDGVTLYTQPQSFITPSTTSGVLPGDVTVLGPKTNTTIKTDKVLILWTPVPGALMYRIRMTDSSGKSFSPGSDYVDGSQYSFWVNGLVKGETYTWKIKAYNFFGWGSYTDDLVFHVQ